MAKIVKKIIYRLQNSKGQGPYWHEFRDTWEDPKNNHNNLPTPYEEKNIVDQFKAGVHVCGFKSLKQLGKWFTKKEFREMKKIGLNLVAIEVPENQIIKGKKQIVFPKKFMKQAKPVLKVNINHIFIK